MHLCGLQFSSVWIMDEWINGRTLMVIIFSLLFQTGEKWELCLFSHSILRPRTYLWRGNCFRNYHYFCPETHWSIQLWFVSYSYTHSLYHFINQAVVALKSYLQSFVDVKSAQAIYGFNLKRMKESPDGAEVQKYKKAILKQWYLHYWPGVTRVLKILEE